MIVSASTWLSSSQLWRRASASSAIGKSRTVPYTWISRPVWLNIGWELPPRPFPSALLLAERVLSAVLLPFFVVGIIVSPLFALSVFEWAAWVETEPAHATSEISPYEVRE